MVPEAEGDLLDHGGEVDHVDSGGAQRWGCEELRGRLGVLHSPSRLLSLVGSCAVWCLYDEGEAD